MKKFTVQSAVAVAIIVVTLLLLSIIPIAYQAGNRPTILGHCVIFLITAGFVLAAYESIKIVFKQPKNHQYHATKQLTGETEYSEAPKGKVSSPT